MSSKNIVNPDHYKVAGRDRPNEVVDQVQRQRLAEEESRLRREAHEPAKPGPRRAAAPDERQEEQGKEQSKEAGNDQEGHR